VSSLALRKIPMRVLLVLSLALLSSCAGIRYATDNYSAVEVKEYAHHPTEADGQAVTKHFRIFDKPAENRMMITASMSDALSMGMTDGLLFNATNSDHPSVIYREAALGFLRQSGRDCEAVETFLIVKPQWEVRYRCKA
jgi:hypothetical protein